MLLHIDTNVCAGAAAAHKGHPSEFPMVPPHYLARGRCSVRPCLCEREEIKAAFEKWQIHDAAIARYPMPSRH